MQCLNDIGMGLKQQGLIDDRIDGDSRLGSMSNVKVLREKRKGLNIFCVGEEVGEEVGDWLLKLDIAHQTIYKPQPTNNKECHLL